MYSFRQMAEVLDRQEHPAHFSEYHADNGDTLICMGDNNQCSISVEIASGYNAEQVAILTTASRETLAAIDKLLEGRSTKAFAGMRVRIGEGLTEGGGEAKVSENEVLLSGTGMLMSLAQMREVVDEYDPGDLRGGAIPEDEPGGALKYTLAHEIMHVAAGHVNANDPTHPGLSAESPTRYGREPDKWHDSKDNEALCDGFAHMVWQMPVTETMRLAVMQTISERTAE